MGNCGDSKNISGFQELDSGERWTGRVEEILEQWKYSVWYFNDGYMSLHIFTNFTECVTLRVFPNIS